MQIDQTRPLANSEGSRSGAIESISQYYKEGGFVHDLAELVALPTESQRPESTIIEGLLIMTGLFQDLGQMGRNGMPQKASADLNV